MIWTLVVSPCARAQDEPPDSPGFVVVVNAENPVERLSVKLTAHMFLKKTRRWDDADTTIVVPVDLEATSEVRQAFSRHVHGKSASAIESYWQRMIFSGRDVPTYVGASEAEVLAFVREERGAIAYLAADVELGEGVKALAIEDRSGKVLPAFEGPFRAARGRPPNYESPRPLPSPESAQAGTFTTTAREDAKVRGRTRSDSPRAPSGQALALLADSADSAVLLASFSGLGVERSEDRGRTWTPVLDEPITAFRVYDGGERLMLAAGPSGLYRSRDGGRIFEATGRRGEGLLIGITDIELDPRDPQVVYASTASRLFISDDQGRTFTDAGLDTRGFESTENVQALAVHPDDGRVFVVLGTERMSALYESRNQGRTWDLVQTILLPVVDLVIDPLSTVFYAATTMGVMASLGGNADWELTSLQVPILDLATASPAVLALTREGLYRSLDNGATWDLVFDEDATVITVDARNPSTLYLGSRQLVYRSLDLGNFWERGGTYEPRHARLDALAERRPPQREVPPVPLVLNEDAGADHVAALVADPASPGIIYAGTRRGVFKSRDHGASWALAGAGLEVADVHALAVDPKRSTTLYAATHGAGVWKSVDGARSWQPARRGLADPVVHSLAIDPHTPSIVYAGTRSGIYASLDGGSSWRGLDEVDDHGNVRAVSASQTAGTLAFYPADPLRVTGVSASGHLLAGHAVAGTLGRRAGHFELGRVSCGARRGRACLDRYGIDPDRLTTRDLHFEDDGTFYSANLFGLWRYDDELSTWLRFPVVTNAAALALQPVRSDPPTARPVPAADRRDAKRQNVKPPTRIFAGGANGLVVSDDSGQTWQDGLFGEAVYALAVDPRLPWRIYAGLDEQRLLILRREELPDAPVRYLTEGVRLPSHLPSKPGKVSSPWPSGEPVWPETRPTELTPQALRLWRGLWAVPATAPDLRAALALELLKRVPRVHVGTVRTALAGFLDEIAELGQDIREIGYSPDSRWLRASYFFDDGHGLHSELRLYDLEDPFGALRLEPAGLRPELVEWRALHELTHESVHLRPTWVLPDPGDLLAWSENARFVATQPSYGRLSVWNVALPSGSLEASRVPPVRSFPFHLLYGDSLSDGWQQERVMALADDGRYFAVTHRRGRETLIRLVRLIPGHERADVLPLPPSSSPDIRQNRVQQLLFSRDGRWLLAFGNDGTAWRFNVHTPDEPGEEFHRAASSYRQVLRSGDGRFVIALLESDVLVWTLTRSGPGEVRTLPVAGGPVFHPILGPDSRLAVSTSGGEVLVWNLSAEDPAAGVLRFARDHGHGVFSHDHEGLRFILHPSGAGPTAFWDLDVKPLRRRLTRIGRVTDADALRWPLYDRRGASPTRAWSRDRRFFAEVSHHSLRLWDFGALGPRAALAQVDRFGPVGIHADEWAPPHDATARGTSTCARVGRYLSREEWAFFLRDEPYAPQCGPLVVTTAPG